METVLYEFYFDYGKASESFFVLFLGVAFFFADKLIGKRPASGYDSNNNLHYVVNAKEDTPKLFKIILRCVGVFCFVLFFIDLGGFIAEYNDYKTMLETDNVLVVEGYVEKFHPHDGIRKEQESFEIDGVRFEYSDADGTNGYKVTAERGGVIRGNGQHLKIKYTVDDMGENVILYIAGLE
jgi:hypothetical protein